MIEPLGVMVTGSIATSNYPPPPAPRPMPHSSQQQSVSHHQRRSPPAGPAAEQDTRTRRQQQARESQGCSFFSGTGNVVNNADAARKFSNIRSAPSKSVIAGRTGFSNAHQDRSFRSWARELDMVAYFVIADSQTALTMLSSRAVTQGVTLFHEGIRFTVCRWENERLPHQN